MYNNRQQIIRAIQRLHRRGEPLNITAVKRQHSELIKAVYKIKPFWGWKRAIEAACLRYTELKVELQNFIVCEVCRKDYMNLTVHLVKKHGIEPREYLIDYPDAPLTCEALRAQWSRMHSDIAHHWEKLWSKEYLLDRVSALHELGLPVNAHWVRHHEVNLLHYARRYGLNDWNDVLRAVSLDPRQIYFTLRYPDKLAVIKAIQARHKLGIPLTFTALVKSDRADHSLSKNATRYFGSWYEAVRAAGFSPESIFKEIRLNRLKRSKYPDKQSVVQAIHERQQRGSPLDITAIKDEQQADYALLHSAWQLFGAWRTALLAAGIDPQTVCPQRKKRYPDSATVIRGIRDRHARGLSLNISKLYRGDHVDTALASQAVHHFGAWHQALRAAGLDPLAVLKPGKQARKYSSKDAVLAEVRNRLKRRWPINHAALYRGSHINPPLATAGTKYFGSWPQTLQAVGIDARSLGAELRRQKRFYPDKKSVLTAVRERIRKKFAVNYLSLVAGKHRATTLLAWGTKYFGSWNKALKAAGLDPRTIVKHRHFTAF